MKDHEWSDFPICPHCGKPQRHAEEMIFPGLEGTTDAECDHCEKPYKVTRHCLFRFSTEKPKP